MSEHQFNDAYRLGYGDGKHDGLKDAKDEFWCGFCVALAAWPLAAIAWIMWRVF